jgi:hypothetical protein
MAKKPKNKKNIELKKTRGGAFQYGSEEDFAKAAKMLDEKFMKDTLADPDILEKKNMLQAGEYAASGYDTGSLEKQQSKFAKEKAKKRRAKKPVKKESGGLIGGQKKLDKNKDGKISGEDFKMMNHGGVVMPGRGGKFKGIS